MTQNLDRSRIEEAIRRWSVDRRQRRLARRALRATYKAFARRNPRWTQSLFDRHLLESRIVPLLDEALRNRSPLTACALATAWASQLTRDECGQRRLALRAKRVSEEFIELLLTLSETRYSSKSQSM